jgi:hypothetical protein
VKIAARRVSVSDRGAALCQAGTPLIFFQERLELEPA